MLESDTSRSTTVPDVLRFDIAAAVVRTVGEHRRSDVEAIVRNLAASS